MQILVRGGDGLLGLLVSCDERYARFAHGALLHAAAIDYVHHHTDARWIDTCASADNEFLKAIYPDRTRLSTLLLSLHGPVDHLLVTSLPYVRALHKSWCTLADRTRAPAATS